VQNQQDSSSAGFEEVTATLIKQIIAIIAEPLSTMFHLSLLKNDFSG